MPFREKSAWISLVGLIMSFGGFFVAMGRGLIPIYGARPMQLFFGCFIGFLILQVILHIIAAATAPKDAMAPADEREKLISLKADRNSNYALICGVLLVPLSMYPHGPSSTVMGYTAILALVVGEMVRYASRIAYYRIGDLPAR